MSCILPSYSLNVTVLLLSSAQDENQMSVEWPFLGGLTISLDIAAIMIMSLTFSNNGIIQ